MKHTKISIRRKTEDDDPETGMICYEYDITLEIDGVKTTPDSLTLVNCEWNVDQKDGIPRVRIELIPDEFEFEGEADAKVLREGARLIRSEPVEG